MTEVPSEQTESTTHSFIVKISIEKTVGESGKAHWHGYVTHVPGGERRYLKDLYEILDFIIPYLENAHVRLGAYHWIKKWRAWTTRARKSSEPQPANKSVEER